MDSVGHILRGRREAAGLSLGALARAVGVAKSYLSMIENGRVANPPSGKVLRALEEVLGIGDGALVRAAAWQVTPMEVRREMEAAVRSARRGEELARRLREAARQRREGGRDLDALFRSGELARWVGEDAREQEGKEERGQRHPPRVWVDFGGGVGVVPLINRVAAGVPCEFTDLDLPVGVADAYVACPGMEEPGAFAARVTGDSMEPMYREGDIVVFSPTAAVTDGCDCFVRLEPDSEVTFKRIYFEQGADGKPGGRIRLQPLNERYQPRVVEREQVTGLWRAVARWQRL